MSRMRYLLDEVPDHVDYLLSLLENNQTDHFNKN